MKQQAWLVGVIALAIAGSAHAQQPSKDPDALQRELAGFEQNDKHLEALFPVAELGSIERLLKLVQTKSERSQFSLDAIKISTGSVHRGGLQSLSIAVIANGVSLTQLLRFLNSLERSERFMNVELLQVGLGAPDPEDPKEVRLNARLTVVTYTDHPSTKRPRDVHGRVVAHRKREVRLLQMFAHKVMWSLKLSRVCAVVAKFPQVWLRGLKISTKRGLELDVSCAGSSLRDVSKFRSALRADAVLMAGLGRLGDVEVRLRSLPPGSNVSERLEFGVRLPRAVGRPVPHLPDSSSPGVARFVRASLSKDTKAAVSAWSALRKAEPSAATDPSLQVLAARALEAEGDDAAAASTLRGVLEQTSDHPTALFLLARLLARKDDLPSRAKAKDLLLMAARHGNREVFIHLQRMPKIREDRTLVPRLLSAATDYQVRSRQPRNPFQSPLRAVKPEPNKKQQ